MLDCRFSADYQSLNDTVTKMMKKYEQEVKSSVSTYKIRYVANIHCLQVNQLKEALKSYRTDRIYTCFVDGRQFDYGTFLQIDDKKICYCSVRMCSVFSYNIVIKDID